jgi:anhydro-N-acetylmuramic acid kinase
VVADFRTADVAAGGHGAPLASYFDAAVFGDAPHPTAVQNIGGMGNVTFIPADSSPQSIIAFDTGPGNALIDFGARHFSGGTRLCDVDGAMADAGTPHQGLLAQALAHPYFSQRPPKTTGREVFGDTYAEEFIGRAMALGLTRENTMATLTTLTAESIARSYRNFGPGSIKEVIVSGGGVRNPALMRKLRELLPEVQFHTLDDLGFPADAKEAAAFALLGYEAIHGRPTNLPGCTGALHPAILGKIVPGSNYRALMELTHGRKAPTPQPLAQGERAPWPPIRKVRLLH